MDKIIHLLFGALLTLLMRWFGGRWGLLLGIPLVLIAAVLKERFDLDQEFVPDMLDFVATFLGWVVVAALNFVLPNAADYVDKRRPQFYHMLILLFIMGSLLAFLLFLDIAPKIQQGL